MVVCNEHSSQTLVQTWLQAVSSNVCSFSSFLSSFINKANVNCRKIPPIYEANIPPVFPTMERQDKTYDHKRITRLEAGGIAFRGMFWWWPTFWKIYVSPTTQFHFSCLMGNQSLHQNVGLRKQDSMQLWVWGSRWYTEDQLQVTPVSLEQHVDSHTSWSINVQKRGAIDMRSKWSTEKLS